MTTYELFRGSDLLGTIEQTEDDFPWHLGRFRPAEAFVTVEALFRRELELLHGGLRTDEQVQAWEAAWAEVSSPGIRLLEAGKQQSIEAPLIHIEGNQTWWR